MLVIYRGLYIFFAEIYEENAEAWRADYLNLGVFVSNSSLTRTTCPWAEGVVVKEPRRQCHYITNDPRSFTSYFCASYFRTSYYQVHIEFDQYEGSRACGIQLCGIKVFELSKHNGRLLIVLKILREFIGGKIDLLIVFTEYYSAYSMVHTRLAISKLLINLSDGEFELFFIIKSL